MQSFVDVEQERTYETQSQQRIRFSLSPEIRGRVHCTNMTEHPQSSPDSVPDELQSQTSHPRFVFEVVIHRLAAAAIVFLIFDSETTLKWGNCYRDQLAVSPEST